jgi:hypothetical protein
MGAVEISPSFSMAISEMQKCFRLDASGIALNIRCVQIGGTTGALSATRMGIHSHTDKRYRHFRPNDGNDELGG